jgi:hypothetical protein
MVGGGARVLARGKSRRAGEACNDNANQQTAGAEAAAKPLCYKRNPFSGN